VKGDKSKVGNGEGEEGVKDGESKLIGLSEKAVSKAKDG